MGIVKVYRAVNDIQASILQSSLEAEGIPCFAKEPGAGQWTRISMGLSEFGLDIYVDEDNQQKALEVIENTLKDAELDTLPEDEIDIASYPWYKRRNGVLRALLLSVVAILVVVYACVFIFCR